jgi:hypothetical protein
MAKRVKGLRPFKTLYKKEGCRKPWFPKNKRNKIERLLMLFVMNANKQHP